MAVDSGARRSVASTRERRDLERSASDPSVGGRHQLDEAAASGVVSIIGKATPGSVLIFPYIHKGVLDGSRHFEARALIEAVKLGEPWVSGCCPPSEKIRRAPPSRSRRRRISGSVSRETRSIESPSPPRRLIPAPTMSAPTNIGLRVAWIGRAFYRVAVRCWVNAGTDDPGADEKNELGRVDIGVLSSRHHHTGRSRHQRSRRRPNPGSMSCGYAGLRVPADPGTGDLGDLGATNIGSVSRVGRRASVP